MMNYGFYNTSALKLGRTVFCPASKSLSKIEKPSPRFQSESRPSPGAALTKPKIELAIRHSSGNVIFQLASRNGL
jgi:hypothetical protein